MKSKLLAGASALAIVVGCSGESNSTATIPPIKNLGNVPPADAVPGATADGKSSGGENVQGPRRSDADKKIAEIKENESYSDELKKQLIDEVERTYKEAQAGIKPK